MKITLISFTTLLMVALSAFAGRKSMVPGSNDGYYLGGQGSSHRGGHYYNPRTGNDYRDRQDGVPYSFE